MTFLEDMYQLMQAAHFRLLSADDWKTAQAEQFTVRLWQHPTHGCIVVSALSGIRLSLGRVIHLLYSFSGAYTKEQCSYLSSRGFVSQNGSVGYNA